MPDALNRMASLNAAAPLYDANGNLTADTRGNGYAYNADNQLVARGATSLAYDPAGNLATIAGPATTVPITIVTRLAKPDSATVFASASPFSPT